MNNLIAISPQTVFTVLCREIIAEHTSELTIRRSQLTQISSDGVVDNSRWAREVEFFIEQIVDPQTDNVGRFPERLNTVRSLIDAATVHYLSSRVCFCLDKTHDRYEQLVADSLSNLGWHAQLINVRDDDHEAVMAEMGGKRILIHCRRYASSVGMLAIETAQQRLKESGADYAAIVSDGHFTARARQLAGSRSIIVLHHNRLMQLEERLFGTDAWRSIPPRTVRDALSVEIGSCIANAA